MIHVATLDPIADFLVDQVCSRLYLAYGIGSEPVGTVALPEGCEAGEALLAWALLDRLPRLDERISDDRTLVLTTRPLRFPEGPLGEPPAEGLADPKAGRAVVTTCGLQPPKRPLSAETEEAWGLHADRIARRAVQQVGFLWGLHRCLDARCAMATPWARRVVEGGYLTSTTLCEFCRTKSEARLEQTRS